MRKFLVVSAIFIMFISMSIVTGVQPIKDARILEPDGSFSGYLTDIIQQDPIIYGNISGIYKMRNRGGGFNASWDLEYQNFSGSGTLRGIFGKHILLGKLSVVGFNKTLPIIGFIFFDKVNLTFKGRVMSIIGPALYFWGTYEPY